MDEIKINLRKSSGTRVGSGHRSSNGWVSSWIGFIEYEMTVDRDDLKLSINECNQIKAFAANYQNSYERDQDWGVYVEDECCEESIDLTSLIENLNLIQTKRKYIAVPDAQKLPVDKLISNSLSVYNQSLQVLRDTYKDEAEAISKLKQFYIEKRIKLVYPFLKELINQDQINLKDTFMSTGMFPVDIIIANNDWDMLLDVILKHKTNLRYSDVNNVYGALVTKYSYSYLDLIHKIDSSLSKKDIEVLYDFVTEIESEYGMRVTEKNDFGNNQSRLLLKSGMLTLVGHLLSQGKFSEWESITNSSKVYSKWNFSCYELVTLVRFANLAFERWDNLNLTNTYWEGSDYRFFSSYLYGNAMLFKNLLPFYIKIRDNNNLIKRLSIIYKYHANGMNAYEYLLSKVEEQIEKLRCIKNNVGPWC